MAVVLKLGQYTLSAISIKQTNRTHKKKENQTERPLIKCSNKFTAFTFDDVKSNQKSLINEALIINFDNVNGTPVSYA